MVDAERAAGFARFHSDHGARVYQALGLTLGDRELAADATQEALARAWQNWARVESLRNPAGWVYRVGLNWARSRLRRWSREVAWHRALDRESGLTDPVDPALEQALRQLSANHRAVLVLRFWMDWSLEDAADALGIPVGTAKSRQHWALKRLRERMETQP